MLEKNCEYPCDPERIRSFEYAIVDRGIDLDGRLYGSLNTCFIPILRFAKYMFSLLLRFETRRQWPPTASEISYTRFELHRVFPPEVMCFLAIELTEKTVA